MSRKRIREPNRKQGTIRFEVPEDGLPPTHPARVLWEVVGTLDLSGFGRKVKSLDGRPGRSAVSPRMKLTLWLYGLTRGIGSAREIARLVQSDDAFRWIVGDLSVHHDTLSAFRAEHRDVFDALLTNVLSALMHKGVLSLELVAQDGIRIRACATAPSFRASESLEECREQAALHVKAVLAQTDGERTAAQHARQVAAAKDFQARVDEAIKTVTEMQVRDAKRPPRASTTDSEARIMKMADGGFRPAYNVQLATAGSPLGGARTIVGVRVTNVGSDMNAIQPMLDDIERRTGQLPEVVVADANHAGHDGIRNATERGVEIIVPVPQRSRAGARVDNHPIILDWQARMETEGAKRIYKARASLCELTNAHLRNRRGIDQFLVRGLAKVMSVVLLGALASNLLAHASTLLG